MNKWIILTLLLFQAVILFAANTVKINVTAPENIEAGKEFTISFEIYKNNLTGFARLEIFLPVGFRPGKIDAGGATCIIQNDLLKIIWIELPEKPIVTVSVSVTADKRIAGYKELYGNFHYIQNKQRTKVPLEIVPFQVKNDNKQITNEPENKIITGFKPVIPQKNLVQETVYRVQIAAYKKRLGKEIISELYAAPAYVNEENMDGLYKYTIGDFISRDDADIFRQKCGVSGAFVVMYENGIRVIK